LTKGCIIVYVQSRKGVILHWEQACSWHELQLGPTGWELTAEITPTGVVRLRYHGSANTR
jgi:hypothetical protein